MVDPISSIRQMMVESKFNEAQRLAELQLSLQQTPSRKILLNLYLEILEQQHLRPQEMLLIEAAENYIDDDLEEAAKLMKKLEKVEAPQDFLRTQILKIKMAEKRGRFEVLYQLISEIQIYFFSVRVPARTELVDRLVNTYFKNDFQIKLQSLAINFMLGDFKRSESILQDLIFSCFEKGPPRGTAQKLIAISELIKVQTEKKQFEIYLNYCKLRGQGIESKADFKKLIEMIIYFETYRQQVLVLDLMFHLGLEEETNQYANAIRHNSDYDFVYLEKYFPHLKGFFAAPLEKKTEPRETFELDLDLEDAKSELPVKMEEISAPIALDEDEFLLINSLKLQELSHQELSELAVSFLQSELYRAALKASEMAMKRSSNDHDYLRACYLKLTCLIKISDFRAVLDLSLDAMSRSLNTDDLLSLLYLQAEAYIKLDDLKDAKKVLKRIMSINPNYRLTKERLARLNEV